MKDGKDSKDLTRFLVDTFYGYMLQHMDDLSEW